MFELRQTPWPANAVHVILDWETMGIAHNAAPVQLGAVTVDGRAFNEYIDPKSSEAAGLEVSTETMRRWNSKDPELRKVVFGGTKSLETVMYEFMNWLETLCFDYEKDCADWSRIFLWGNGVEFDIKILLSAHEAAIPHLKFPISFRNFDHVRTLYRCVPQSLLQEVTDVFNATNPDAQVHNAVADAMYHAKLVAACLGYINWVRDAY